MDTRKPFSRLKLKAVAKTEMASSSRLAIHKCDGIVQTGSAHPVSGNAAWEKQERAGSRHRNLRVLFLAVGRGRTASRLQQSKDSSDTVLFRGPECRSDWAFEHSGLNLVPTPPARSARLCHGEACGRGSVTRAWGCIRAQGGHDVLHARVKPSASLSDK